jgi:hypothetical protein
MRYNDDVICGNAHVEFQRIHADLKCAGETNHGILRIKATGPAVAVQFDFVPHRHRVGSGV